MIETLLRTLILSLILLATNSWAGSGNKSTQSLEQPLPISSIIEHTVKERFEFQGLARYLNGVHYYLVQGENIEPITADTSASLKTGQWLNAAGRFRVLVLQADGLKFHLTDEGLSLGNPELLSQDTSHRGIVEKTVLAFVAPELDQIRYAHLWSPLAILAKGFESLLVWLERTFAIGWGWSLVCAAAVIRVLLLPVTVCTQRAQNRANLIAQQLTPELTKIKAAYAGEDAHNRIMEAHKKLGVSPFYSLKPVLATAIQIPILIAVFNALAEMPQLGGQTLLWVKDLAYPDALLTLGFNLPLLGNHLNLLPLIMTAVSILAAHAMYNPKVSVAINVKQRRNHYLMSLLFLILFYPFPAAMVFYWTVATLLSAMQQKILRLE